MHVHFGVWVKCACRELAGLEPLSVHTQQPRRPAHSHVLLRGAQVPTDTCIPTHTHTRTRTRTRACTAPTHIHTHTRAQTHTNTTNPHPHIKLQLKRHDAVYQAGLRSVLEDNVALLQRDPVQFNALMATVDPATMQWLHHHPPGQ